MVLLERKFPGFVVRLQHVALLPYTSRYVFGQQCCPYFRQKALRQVSTFSQLCRTSFWFYYRNILPRENLLVSYITNGEGFHNYHHAFPWDYKAAELGSYYGNWSTAFIDFMARVGWAYDLKSVPTELVSRKVRKSGDGSWQFLNDYSWGWVTKK